MAGPGETFGPYRIVRRIGVGGMAETFLAVRFGPRNFEQRVCLKRVLPAFELDAKFVEQFVEEASIAASLRHSNIVGVIDVGEVGGTHFMALELVEGADLRSVLAKLPGERLRPDLVILLAVELAQALHHAHTQMRRGGPTGVVHRDISPSNVLISYAGEIKLADFGIAKAMRNSSASASGVVKGKIPYMAPEQARAEDLDARSDLFSLGVLLFEALSGRRPFDGATDVQTLTRVLSGERQFLREAAPDAPEELVETIERLLAFDREERWPSAEALLAALAKLPPVSPTARFDLGDLAKLARPPESLEPGADTASETGAFRPEGASTTPGKRRSDPALPGAVRVSDPSAATMTRLSSDDGAVAVADEPSHTVPDPEPSRLDVAAADARAPHSKGALEELQRSAAATDPEASLKANGVASRARRAPWVFVAFVCALALVAWAAARSGTTEATPEENASRSSEGPVASAPASPAPASPAPGDPTPEPVRQAARLDAPAEDTTAAPPPDSAPTDEAPGDAEPTAATATEPQPAAADTALVTVLVEPWGFVWVDGKYMGRAPAVTRLSLGKHVFSAGYADAPLVTKPLKIRNARRRSVLLKLPVQ